MADDPATAAEAEPQEAAAGTEADSDTEAPAPEAPAADPAPATEAAPAQEDEAAAERRKAEACKAKASHLLDAVEKGDFDAATKDFDARMRAALTPDQFRANWASLARFGALTARGQLHAMKGDGYLAVTIPLIFEKGTFYAQVACGNDGRVAGFYVKPLDVPTH